MVPPERVVDHEGADRARGRGPRGVPCRRRLRTRTPTDRGRRASCRSTRSRETAGRWGVMPSRPRASPQNRPPARRTSKRSPESVASPCMWAISPRSVYRRGALAAGTGGSGVAAESRAMRSRVSSLRRRRLRRGPSAVSSRRRRAAAGNRCHAATSVVARPSAGCRLSPSSATSASGTTALPEPRIRSAKVSIRGAAAAGAGGSAARSIITKTSPESAIRRRRSASRAWRPAPSAADPRVGKHPHAVVSREGQRLVGGGRPTSARPCRRNSAAAPGRSRSAIRGTAAARFAAEHVREARGPRVAQAPGDLAVEFLEREHGLAGARAAHGEQRVAGGGEALAQHRCDAGGLRYRPRGRRGGSSAAVRGGAPGGSGRRGGVPGTSMAASHCTPTSRPAGRGPVGSRRVAVRFRTLSTRVGCRPGPARLLPLRVHVLFLLYPFPPRRQVRGKDGLKAARATDGERAALPTEGRRSAEAWMPKGRPRAMDGRRSARTRAPATSLRAPARSWSGGAAALGTSKRRHGHSKKTACLSHALFCIFGQKRRSLLASDRRDTTHGMAEERVGTWPSNCGSMRTRARSSSAAWRRCPPPSRSPSARRAATWCSTRSSAPPRSRTTGSRSRRRSSSRIRSRTWARSC